MGNVLSLSPTTNLPDFMLAPVFASMIEPSVVSPGGPALPMQRRDGSVLSDARWEAAVCVAHPSVHRKTAEPARRSCRSAWRLCGDSPPVWPERHPRPRRRNSTAGDRRDGLVL